MGGLRRTSNPHDARSSSAARFPTRGAQPPRAPARTGPQPRAIAPLKRYPSSRRAFSVTSTVAPVSARTAGQRPVMPTTVVTRNTALRPRAIGDVLVDVGQRRARQPDQGGDVHDAAVQQRGVGGLQGHVGAPAHGDADRGGGQRGRVVDAVADHGHRRPRLQGARSRAACPRAAAPPSRRGRAPRRWPALCGGCRRSA